MRVWQGGTRFARGFTIGNGEAIDGTLPLNPFGIAYWRMRPITGDREAIERMRPIAAL